MLYQHNNTKYQVCYLRRNSALTATSASPVSVRKRIVTVASIINETDRELLAGIDIVKVNKFKLIYSAYIIIQIKIFS